MSETPSYFDRDNHIFINKLNELCDQYPKVFKQVANHETYLKEIAKPDLDSVKH